MKIVAKPIDTIFLADKYGKIRPLRFKFEENGSSVIIVVDRIIKEEQTKRAGEAAFVFTCESEIEQIRKIYELRYTIANCTWVLYKIWANHERN